MSDDETDRLRSRLHGVRLVGLVGGVASGKSLVGQEFERLGALVLDADRAAHAVLLEPEVEHAARQRWGLEILTPEGRIDRRRLAARVFGSEPEASRERAFLEELVHPRIARRLAEEVLAAGSGYRVAILDAPVLMEAGWDRLCDCVVFVAAPEALRRRRAQQRGWRPEDFAIREAAQKTITEKRSRADDEIDNSGSIEATRAQVGALWQRWVG